MPLSDTMTAYYDGRAAHMEAGYQEPLPPWVSSMVAHLQRTLSCRRVLEVACGTGHWTRHASEVAAAVTGVDPAPEMRRLAASKGLQVLVMGERCWWVSYRVRGPG